ncbi:hypothetical protein AVEN_150262-1 [Araneus ventricosus]|uniref:Uncharacterized protein n=1 Tax=Araneus ventricosus TaxID=182803 RepID=A0A4Y2HCX6_ARAVE|nr:hypothetical protein AVEN_150262-1 [Araneus ventricosus]
MIAASRHTATDIGKCENRMQNLADLRIRQIQHALNTIFHLQDSLRLTSSTLLQQPQPEWKVIYVDINRMQPVFSNLHVKSCTACMEHGACCS